jgi:hypothetical protein
MNAQQIVRAWGRILQGRRPSLSIEITRECPLRCPGCYAYEPGHPGEGLNLRGGVRTAMLIATATTFDQSKRRFDDSTSVPEPLSAPVVRIGPVHSGNPTNGTPG